ncbi:MULTISPECIES: SLC13 family permease [unclassified Butyrivibrio]|uniref:SLC13 family permease n=1 Tax=unclassified Butyrivibrio TaxID=2639466 RepID=UPI0008F03754|nr:MULTISPECIES: SLC13 family permease [unclassified Butyrivibrio]RKM60120.1 arsenic transporter [Butyrivibrio sp. XB500-5]SFU53789.1 Na+/H+ antiporter NhaD [Butyrivibrio sp. INlla21]
MKTIAIILFILMYILMITLPKRRAIVALSTAVVFVILGILPINKVFGAIDWNILMMIFGTMVIVDYFIESKMPNLIADKLLNLAPNVMWVTIFMSLFSGIISAFIDNVATLLMVAPVGLAICKKLKISPVPMIICIAVSSNLQGAATLVGDTTSIMLAGAAHMDFNDFFWMNGHPGIFFAVELGALATVPIMMYLFRKDKEPVHSNENTVVTDYVPTITMLGHVVFLVIASFFQNKPEITNGVICMVCGIINIIWEIQISKGTDSMWHSLKAIDYDTMLLLAGLFCVIAGIRNVGIIDDLANMIATAGKGNVFLLYTVIVFGSVAVSAFIDNIPYVATMLPVLYSLSRVMNTDPIVLYFGLLIGATLGGNLTPIGASANIAGVGMLRKDGYEVSFGDFMRIGVPFTLTAVVVGYLFIWFVYA